MSLNYNKPLFRPPSEGENLIIQATLGCSFNQCSFCSMYTQKQYQERPLNDIFKDIQQAAQQWPETQRVFLADGDALTLPTEQLIAILQELNTLLPKLTRISCYASPSNILHKSLEELEQLKQHKLSLLYFGVESGSNLILKKVAKGASQKSIKNALHKAHDCGIKISATVILGLGGKTHWQEHIDGSISLLNDAPVTYLSTLQLILHESAINNFKEHFGEPFEMQNDQAILLEQQRFIAGLEPPQAIIFRSNHASNALALAGNLPRDKSRLLTQLESAIDGKQPLRPDYIRGL